MPPYQKLLMGCIGALCLSILKLIGANFYLGSTDSAAVYGAYLTYLGYLILGAAPLVQADPTAVGRLTISVRRQENEPVSKKQADKRYLSGYKDAYYYH